MVSRDNGKKPSALESLQAVMLISKHLSDLLPFLMALRNVPAEIPQRVGLVQETARSIAKTADFAQDWYQTLELLTGENLSNRSVADLILMTPDIINKQRLGDIWRAAYDIGLLSESLLQEWVFFEALTGRE